MLTIRVNQANLIMTSPIIGTASKQPLTDAVVTARIYDHGIILANSDIVLPHAGNGVYQAVWPVLAVVNQGHYILEFTVTHGGVVVWYLKGPLSAVLLQRAEEMS